MWNSQTAAGQQSLHPAKHRLSCKLLADSQRQAASQSTVIALEAAASFPGVIGKLKTASWLARVSRLQVRHLHPQDPSRQTQSQSQLCGCTNNKKPYLYSKYSRALAAYMSASRSTITPQKSEDVTLIMRKFVALYNFIK